MSRPAPRGARLRAFATIFAIAFALFATMLLPGAGGVALAAGGSGTTVAGSWFRWDPVAGAVDTSESPTVTVDQTTDLVDQVVHVSWTGFTPTSNDLLYSGVPTPPVTNTTNTAATTFYPVEVFQCRGTAPVVSPENNQGKKSECYAAPVDSPVDGGQGLNNAAPGVTQADGSGSLNMHVETRITNDSLGCDSMHPCSIVVVPNNGGIQPNSSAAPDCADHSSDFLEPPDYSQISTYANGSFIGQACSWADRITIPIHFAPIAQQCSAVAPQFNAVGSPMLERGLSQWQAGWCRGANPVTFNYNSTTDEYQARSAFAAGGTGALTADTDVALVTRPADPTTAGSRKFTYAPVANNAISIAYAVDNVKTGLPITDLRLDARLVAKLITQSYQPFHFNCQGTAPVAGPGCAPEVAGNPTSILDDPEFQALNFRGDHPDRSYFPRYSDTFQNDGVGGDLMSVLAGNSDLTYELTRWIADDPEAAAFLKGQPDQWGMHINSYYLPSHGAPAFPVSLLQPLDPGWTAGTKNVDKRFTEGFQGSWNPVSGLDKVANLLVTNKSTALKPQGICQSSVPTDCDQHPNLPIVFQAVDPEPFGERDLWAVMDNASAQAYHFPTAQLVTSGDGPSATAVAPDTVSMSAAVHDMKTNADRVTQYVDHSVKDPAAYPLTEVDYAMLPTCGLTAAKVSAIGSMLGHIGSSQTYGVQPGTIAPGLQALSNAQLNQVQTAATKLSSTPCSTPPPGNHAGGGPSSSSHRSTAPSPQSNANPPAGSSNPAGGGASPAANSGGGAAAPTRSAESVAPQPATSPAPSAVDVGFKPAAQTESLSLVLPLILIVGGVLVLGAPLTWLATATETGRSAVRRLRLRR